MNAFFICYQLFGINFVPDIGINLYRFLVVAVRLSDKGRLANLLTMFINLENVNTVLGVVPSQLAASYMHIWVAERPCSDTHFCPGSVFSLVVEDFVSPVPGSAVNPWNLLVDALGVNIRTRIASESQS